ncbi:MAG: hypothetical protein ACRD16_15535 [Thermoanaerobaculia bacterium]
MKNFTSRFRVFLLLAAGALAAGCSTTGPAPQTAARARSAGSGRGTLGIETAPISRSARRKLGLAETAKGALVVDVLPGGPGAAAAIRPGDLVEEVGGSRIASECEFVDAAYNRALSPVRVVVVRAGARVEADLTPVEQAPFFEELCGRGNAAACSRQAWALGTSENVRERALALYASACRLGLAPACADEGVRLFQWADRPKDTLAALARACTLGSGAGCAHEAFLYATGKIVKKDDRRATNLYVRGCDLGDAKACYNVGLMADEGRGGPRNLKLAAARYEEACEGGSSTACTNLGFLYENGRGVAKDAARSAALYRRGCDGSSCQASNLNGCVNLGRAYRDGIGVAKDESRSADLFREACDRAVDPDDVGAAENGSRACSLLGALFLDSEPRKALELSELGCGRGDAFGCFNASAIYSAGSGVEASPVKATSFLEKACRAGDGEGCFDLAIAYEKGTGVPADRGRASEAFKRACDLGFSKACGRKS